MKHIYFFLTILSFSSFAQDGTLDTNFKIGSGFNGWSYASRQLSTGDVIVTGNFSSFNGIQLSSPEVTFIQSNGDLKSVEFENFPQQEFVSGNPKAVRQIIEQQDGKLLFINSAESPRIYRYKINGKIDNTFNPGNGADNVIRKAVLQNDGKIILAGDFSNFNGTARPGIVRINSNGTIDTDFMASGSNSGIYDVSITKDGKIYVSGSFSNFNGNSTLRRIVRLNSDASLDSTFNYHFQDFPASSGYYLTIPLTNGKVLIADKTSSAPYRLWRLNNDASIDSSFSGTSDYYVDFDRQINNINVQPDGKILVTGDFNSINGVPAYKIIRLDPDGNIDSGFTVGTGVTHEIFSADLSSWGTLLIGGVMFTYNGFPMNHIARIHAHSVIASNNEANQNDDFKIYPNPTGGRTGIEFDQVLNDADISVYDSKGKVIYSDHLNGISFYEIDLSDESAGIFFLKVKSENQIWSRTIIKLEKL